MGEAVEKQEADLTVDNRLKVDRQKLLELRLKGYSAEHIAKVIGASERQVYRILAKYRIDPKKVKDYKNSKADIMAYIQMNILDSVSKDDLKSASLLQKTTAYGIFVDKERLERGESTSNVNLQGVLANATGDLDRIRERIQGLLSGETVTTATQHVVGQEEDNEGKVVASKKVNDNKGL